MHEHVMEADAVLGNLTALATTGIVAFLGGGSAVDALLGGASPTGPAILICGSMRSSSSR